MAWLAPACASNHPVLDGLIHIDVEIQTVNPRLWDIALLIPAPPVSKPSLTCHSLPIDESTHLRADLQVDDQLIGDALPVFAPLSLVSCESFLSLSPWLATGLASVPGLTEAAPLFSNASVMPAGSLPNASPISIQTLFLAPVLAVSAHPLKAALHAGCALGHLIPTRANSFQR